MLCFFSSMLITNDVALIAFIPFTILVLSMAKQTKHLIFIIVLQTVAANLGSMLTPVGNPQNLYLYSFYQIPTIQFFQLTLVIVGISFVLLTLLCLFIKKENITVSFSKERKLQNKKHLFIYAILFLLSLVSVFRLLPYPILLGIVCIAIFFTNKSLFKEIDIDYCLLFTFLCFFIFVGNLGSIEVVKTAMASFIENKEFLSSLLLSQVISNVPAAVLLSSFTTNY
jgi:Na+/H+ antiporter NhaD/arsenite permease-like protein